MPRALAILKYVPAVLCGLLVVAWVVSAFRFVGYGFQEEDSYFIIALSGGGIGFWEFPRYFGTPHVYAETLPTSSLRTRWFGEMGLYPVEGHPLADVVQFPLLLLITPGL